MRRHSLSLFVRTTIVRDHLFPTTKTILGSQQGHGLSNSGKIEVTCHHRAARTLSVNHFIDQWPWHSSRAVKRRPWRCSEADIGCVHPLRTVKVQKKTKMIVMEHVPVNLELASVRYYPSVPCRATSIAVNRSDVSNQLEFHILREWHLLVNLIGYSMQSEVDQFYVKVD